MRGPKPIDPEKQEQLKKKWAARRRQVWSYALAVAVVAGLITVVANFQSAAQNEFPRILSFYPDPTVSRDMVPNVEGKVTFSMPIDRESVESALRYYDANGLKLKGPFLLRDRGEFNWSEGDRAVTFHLFPEYFPPPGEEFILEAAGMKGKNGKPLIPSSIRFRLRVVDKESTSSYSPKDLRDFYKRWKANDN